MIIEIGMLNRYKARRAKRKRLRKLYKELTSIRVKIGAPDSDLRTLRPMAAEMSRQIRKVEACKL